MREASRYPPPSHNPSGRGHWFIRLDTCIYEPWHKKTNNMLRRKQRCRSAIVFATRILQFLYFLNPNFSVSSHLLCLYSSVCVGHVRKPHFWFSHAADHILFYSHECANHPESAIHDIPAPGLGSQNHTWVQYGSPDPGLWKHDPRTRLPGQYKPSTILSGNIQDTILTK